MEPFPGTVGKRTIPRCGTFPYRPEMFGVWRSEAISQLRSVPPTAPAPTARKALAQNPGEGRAGEQSPRPPCNDSQACSGAGGSTPGWPKPRPLPLPRGRWLWPLFSGRQRSAQPSALVSGHLPARNIQASEMLWGKRKPIYPGPPSSMLTVAGALGTKSAFGSLRKWQQAGHWNLAVPQGRSH